MKICETERLVLRQMSTDDATFALELLNEPAFIHNIRDVGARTMDDARVYLQDGPLASYREHGFGLYAVELKDSRVVIGMCGILKRHGLDDPDIGYAFLSRYCAQGYATEAARAVMAYGRETLGLFRVVAIVKPDNQASIRVLQKIGLRFDRLILLPGAHTESSLFTPEF